MSSSPALPLEVLQDPFKLLQVCWPKVRIYDDQRDIIQSVHSGNKFTIVHAGNMLGKDFISSFIALHYFISRTPCRVLTSSVDHSQLHGVLWGELRRWIDTSVYPLGVKVNDLHIRQLRSDGTIDPLSELIGRVAQTGVKEGLLGRHVPRGPGGAPRALVVIDEASGFEDIHKDALETWGHQFLIIGNCYECHNFFRKADKEGDKKDPTKPGRYFQKVFRIPAERSPNIRVALAEIAAGKKPSHREIIPGCMSYAEYVYRRENWEEQKQVVGLDAQFYEGAEVKLYPQAWLDRSVEMAVTLEASGIERTAKAIGVDVAEGGDNTVFTVVDEWGVIEQLSKKTKDTFEIFEIILAMIDEYGVEPENVVLDIGGGGKPHVDYLTEKGFPVRGISFGAAPTPDPRSQEASKKKYGAAAKGVTAKAAYKNRRAEMYGLLRNRLNPKQVDMEMSNTDKKKLGGYRPIFAIPGHFSELHRQLQPIPLLYDGEGKMYLPPKSKPTPTYKGMTIVQMLGCSPDESDSLVLANYGLTYPVESSVMTVF